MGGMVFMSSKIKMVIQVILATIFLLISTAWVRTFTGFYFIFLSAIIVPIKPFEDLFEKCKITFKTRLIVCIVLAVLGIIGPPIANNILLIGTISPAIIRFLF